MPRKDEEAHYVRQLLSRLEGTPDTEPTLSESPDFLAEVRGRVVGIETTGIVRRSGSFSDLKLREQFQGQVVEAAEQIYLAIGAPSVQVWVYWVHDVVKGDPRVVARELAEFVAGNLPDVRPSGLAMTSIDWRQIPDSLRAQVTGVTIKRISGPPSRFTFGYGTYPEVAPAELQSEIDRKEARAAKFKKRYEELWLLIYATRQGKAEDVVISDYARAARYPTVFDRVFFLDAQGQLLELDVVH